MALRLQRSHPMLGYFVNPSPPHNIIYVQGMCPYICDCLEPTLNYCKYLLIELVEFRSDSPRGSEERSLCIPPHFKFKSYDIDLSNILTYTLFRSTYFTERV